MTIANEDGDTKCEVCFEEDSISIPLLTCSHLHTFCEGCIKKWFETGHHTCPKCRVKLSIEDYLKATGQIDVNTVDVSIPIEYDALPPNAVLLVSNSSSPSYCRIVGLLCCLLVLIFILFFGLVKRLYPGKIKHIG